MRAFRKQIRDLKRKVDPPTGPPRVPAILRELDPAHWQTLATYYCPEIPGGTVVDAEGKAAIAARHSHVVVVKSPPRPSWLEEPLG